MLHGSRHGLELLGVFPTSFYGVAAFRERIILAGGKTGVWELKGNQAEMTQKKLERFKVLMNSMTEKELENPKLVKRSRIQRIAAGAGADVQEIRELLAYYNKSRKMMSTLGGNRRMQKQLMRQIERGDLNL